MRLSFPLASTLHWSPPTQPGEMEMPRGPNPEQPSSKVPSTALNDYLAREHDAPDATKIDVGEAESTF
jgi:hypothetical protein